MTVSDWAIRGETMIRGLTVLALATVCILLQGSSAEAQNRFDGTSAGFRGAFGRAQAKIANYSNGGVYNRLSPYVRFARQSQVNTGYAAYSRTVRSTLDAAQAQYLTPLRVVAPNVMRTSTGNLSNLGQWQGGRSRAVTGHGATFGFGGYNPMNP